MIRRDYRKGDKLTARDVNQIIDLANKLEAMQIQGYDKVSTPSSMSFRKRHERIQPVASATTPGMLGEWYQIQSIDADGDRLWCKKWNLVDATEGDEVEVWLPPGLARSTWDGVEVSYWRGVSQEEGVNKIRYSYVPLSHPHSRMATFFEEMYQQVTEQQEVITPPYISAPMALDTELSSLFVIEAMHGDEKRLYDSGIISPRRAWAQAWVIL